ncbi:MAG: hypothetical protein N4A40_12695 [Tissierellales bacterium]|jgi:hypothetical protein|nr:hypothetical protein [Tissierellales bacterium]
MYPIPTKMGGEERLFSIKQLNLHFNKKSLIYCGCMTLVCSLVSKAFSLWWLFPVLGLPLNILAYILANFQYPKYRFEAGGMDLDKYLLRRIRYNYSKKTYIKGRR